MVMQIGAGDPMEMPVEMTGSKPFTKPNPKTLVGSETIKVAAGSFKTKHYRDKTPQGDKIDFWVSESVPPLGPRQDRGRAEEQPADQGQAASSS